MRKLLHEQTGFSSLNKAREFFRALLDNFEIRKREPLEVLASDLTANRKQLPDAFQLI
jgi:hypothetical protein